MGCIVSRKKEEESKIKNYTKIKIPEKYSIIKISSFDINIKNTINLDNKIKNIINYINTSYNKKQIDIICLQGINDVISSYKLVRELKKYSYNKKIKLFFSPEFEDIEYTEYNNFIGEYKRTSRIISDNSSSKTRNLKKIEVQNIIISKYPIIEQVYAELDTHHDIDDVIGSRSIIGINVSIKGAIISIYNTKLTPNIINANMINDDIRKQEMEEIKYVIDKNKASIKSLKNYKKTNIHFLVGNMNIPEINYIGDNAKLYNLTYSTENSIINNEFIEFVKKFKCIDIYRFLNEYSNGFTNSTNERLNYIMFLFTDEIYDDKTYSNAIKNIKNSQDLLKIIFNKYHIYFFDSYVIKKNISSFFLNYPIETVFMIETN